MDTTYRLIQLCRDGSLGVMGWAFDKENAERVLNDWVKDMRPDTDYWIEPDPAHAPQQCPDGYPYEQAPPSASLQAQYELACRRDQNQRLYNLCKAFAHAGLVPGGMTEAERDYYAAKSPDLGAGWFHGA